MFSDQKKLLVYLIKNIFWGRIKEVYEDSLHKM